MDTWAQPARYVAPILQVQRMSCTRGPCSVVCACAPLREESERVGGGSFEELFIFI